MDLKDSFKRSDVVLTVNDRTEAGCICAIFELLPFLLLCSQDEDNDESSRMIRCSASVSVYCASSTEGKLLSVP